MSTSVYQNLCELGDHKELDKEMLMSILYDLLAKIEELEYAQTHQNLN